MQVLQGVDQLVMLNVYSAGEPAIPGADSRSLCRSIRQRGKEPVFVEDTAELPDVLRNLLQPGDLLLTQGAGSVTAISHDLAQRDLSSQGGRDD